MDKTKYRIILISINSAWKHGNIGIDQLGGYLREKKYNVDMGYFHIKDDIIDIYNKLKDKYIFFGFSITNSNYKKCIDLADLLKQNNKNVVIDFGGGYVTRYYREVFSEVKSLDFITLGDGEEPTDYLLQNLIANQNYKENNFTGHKSVVSRFDMKNKIQNLNGKVSHLPVFDYYEKDTNSRNSRKVHCVQTKNNVCTGNCSFCTERHGKVVYKDIDVIIQQIKIVHNKFGVHKIFFTDDNIFDPNDNNGKEHVKNLCLELKKLDFKMSYQCYCKANSLKDTSEDRGILSLMKEVGFVEVFVGIESGNMEDLKLYNKRTTVEENYNIIRLLYQYKLIPIMGFIGFNPYTTYKKMEKNFKFLCDIKCTFLPNYLYCFVDVNKYTSLYNKIKNDGLILSDDKEYTSVKYTYQNNEVIEILDYIRNVMIPKLKLIDYELDWVIYSYEECLVWGKNIKDFSNILNEYKNEDFNIINNFLKILFVEHDLSKFKKVENEFWNHFKKRQEPLREIYNYLINFHIESGIK